jgi:hypothetical protein
MAASDLSPGPLRFVQVELGLRLGMIFIDAVSHSGASARLLAKRAWHWDLFFHARPHFGDGLSERGPDGRDVLAKCGSRVCKSGFGISKVKCGVVLL